MPARHHIDQLQTTSESVYVGCWLDQSLEIVDFSTFQDIPLIFQMFPGKAHEVGTKPANNMK